MMLRLLPLLLVAGCFQVPTDTSSDNGGDSDLDSDSGDTDTGDTDDSDTDSGDSDDSDTDTSPVESVIDIDIDEPTSPDAFDECGEICFGATVRWDNGNPAAGAEVDFETENYGYLASKVIADADGRATFCTSMLPVGTHEYTVTAIAGEYADERNRAVGSFTVEPFGISMGYIRSPDVLDEVPWVPDFVKYAGNPVLAPNPTDGEFDDVGTFVPTVVKQGGRYYMWYGGQAETGGDYLIGYADSSDGLSWNRVGMSDHVSSGSGIEGDWKAKSTNSPMLVYHDGEWQLFYTGRKEDDGDLNVGLATSTQYNAMFGSGGSAFNVYDLPNVEDGGVNPVIPHIAEEEEWGGAAVAHPSILVNDQGFYEIWFSTGRHRVGYAMSPDGLEWTHYCKNPTLEGFGAPDDDGHMNWEMSRVKSTEVAYYDGYYMMTYTGGNTGDFQLGWAMSKDGLHWAKLEEPLMGPDTESDWENQALQGGFLVVDGQKLKMWYGASFSGGGVSGSAVGYADADLPTSFE